MAKKPKEGFWEYLRSYFMGGMDNLSMAPARILSPFFRCREVYQNKGFTRLNHSAADNARLDEEPPSVCPKKLFDVNAFLTWFLPWSLKPNQRVICFKE